MSSEPVRERGGVHRHGRPGVRVHVPPRLQRRAVRGGEQRVHPQPVRERRVVHRVGGEVHMRVRARLPRRRMRGKFVVKNYVLKFNLFLCRNTCLFEIYINSSSLS